MQVRLVEGAVKGPGWGVPEEALRLLPGPAFEVEQAIDEQGLPIERPRKPTGARLVSACPAVLLPFLGEVCAGWPCHVTAGLPYMACKRLSWISALRSTANKQIELCKERFLIKPSSERKDLPRTEWCQRESEAGRREGGWWWCCPKVMPHGIGPKLIPWDPKPTPTAGGAGSEARRRKVVVVVFIGGVTFAEVAALRFLGRRPEVCMVFRVQCLGFRVGWMG